MNYQQKSFNSGLDFISSDTQVAEDGYIWLVNGRTRYGRVEPTNKHLQLTGFPEGLQQGTITVGNVHFLFIAGRAYYRIDGTDVWIQVPLFQMSAIAKTLWSKAIEASTKHFVRRLNESESVQDDIQETVDFKIQGTPAGIIVQDGVSQPWIIEWDDVNNLFIARETKKYSNWAFNSTTANSREYVPIGRQMMVINSKLYIVAPDKKSIYQSISGRPLDFMVNIDVNGQKLPSESEGGARSTSFAFDFDDITCIVPINVPNSFIYGTSRNVRIVQLDYTKRIFGEPTYFQASIAKAGIVNQESFLELVNGDLAFISPDGVKSFNAIEHLQTKSNGTVFSLQVGHLLTNHTTRKPIKQVNCSCVRYDNYAFFNLDTYWGNIIVTYDMLKDLWCSLDITLATKIKQFAVMETATEDKLFCLNGFNEVFQMYASTETETPEIRFRSLVDNSTAKEQKGVKLVAMFQKGTTDGNAFLTEYVDDQLSIDPDIITNPLNAADYRHRQPLLGSLAGVPFPVIPPVMPNNRQRVDTITFPLRGGLKGKKLSYIMQWTNDSQLIEIEVQATADDHVSLKQKNQTYVS
jgi:hypothetical protein